MELTVAIMLIVLGLLNLFDVRTSSTAVSATRPLFIGVVHGLAGSAAPSLAVSAPTARMQRSLRLASGTVSVVFGLYLAHKVGSGLFTADPQWTPH